jgi:hypothetical protein
LAIIDVLTRVARAVESVVPDLTLQPYIGADTFFDDEESDSDEGAEWSRYLGVYMTYRGDKLGNFEHATTGSESEQVHAVVQELLSQIQDVVSKATAKPWPPVLIDGRQNVAMGDAAIVGDELQMWYGDRAAPALRIPTVSLT